MPRTVTLPSGYTATLREPRELKNKHRKQVLKEMGLSGDLNGTAAINYGDLMGSLDDALIKVAVTNWDVQAVDDATGAPVGDILQVPSLSPASLDELSAEDAVFLGKEVAGLRAVILPDFGPNPSEESPTPPSGA